MKSFTGHMRRGRRATTASSLLLFAVLLATSSVGRCEREIDHFKRFPIHFALVGIVRGQDTLAYIRT